MLLILSSLGVLIMAFQKRQIASALACMFGVGGALLFANAQAADVSIQVTGTNIRRVDTETASPVQVITREEIDRSGLSTISEIIRVLPVNNNGTISEGFTNGFAAGASGVSMRGLGVGATLVLLNGRRLAPYGLADDGQRTFVDLNQIPFDAVERIEVLKDGASAIYGSDAIAGVINVILKTEYVGFNANASAGTSYKGDGNQYRAGLTYGIGDLSKDKYNVFATFDWYQQDSLGLTDRGGYIGNSNLTFIGSRPARRRPEQPRPPVDQQPAGQRPLGQPDHARLPGSLPVAGQPGAVRGEGRRVAAVGQSFGRVLLQLGSEGVAADPAREHQDEPAGEGRLPVQHRPAGVRRGVVVEQRGRDHRHARPPRARSTSAVT